MAYQLPTFNITVGIRHAVAAGEWGDADFAVAQLRGISKLSAAGGSGGPSGITPFLMLKLPAGTDVRDASNFAFTDRVDIDGFSGPCLVVVVYDVAFGFENEYRVALLTREQYPVDGSWALLPGQGVTPQVF